MFVCVSGLGERVGDGNCFVRPFVTQYLVYSIPQYLEYSIPQRIFERGL